MKDEREMARQRALAKAQGLRDSGSGTMRVE